MKSSSRPTPPGHWGRDSYRLDLVGFTRWFAEHVPTEPQFFPEAVTPTAICEFRDWLVQQAKRQPTTINRKLAALRAYVAFCKAQGSRREDSPTDGVKPVAEQPAGPRWFLKREVNALIRKVERHARGEFPLRELAIVLTLRQTGLRVGELVRLAREDVRWGERGGHLRVRGKGNKERIVPPNKEVRQALASWMAAGIFDRMPRRAMRSSRATGPALVPWGRGLGRQLRAPQDLG
jgi:site-specific recombinase XerD